MHAGSQRNPNAWRRLSRSGAVVALVLAGGVPCLAQLTPQQRAGAGGLIPNPSAQEYYLGEVTPGTTVFGSMVGAFSGTKASLSWYKFHSDGVRGIVFDMWGSQIGGGYLGFTWGPDSELAVYNPQGQLVAATEGVRGPATGDSNLPPFIPAGATPPGAQIYRQPDDPRETAIAWYPDDQLWAGRNTNGLSQLSFVPNAQPNPVWDPGHPQYSPNAVWDEFPVLPEGDYFLAVTGYSTYFSGNPRDDAAITTYGVGSPNADGPVTPTTPFGFVSFHAQSGYYLLNVRFAGDLDLDGSLTGGDVDLLKAKVLEFACTDGIPQVGILDGEWVGLPSDMSDLETELARFDLTGNHRIDNYDVLQLGRWTNLNVCPIDRADLDADCDVDADDFAIFAAHTSGPAMPHDGSAVSQAIDFDGDGDVDSVDYARFQRSYGDPPKAPCEN